MVRPVEFITYKQTPTQAHAAYCKRCGGMRTAIADAPELMADIRRDTTKWKLNGYEVRKVSLTEVKRHIGDCKCFKRA